MQPKRKLYTLECPGQLSALVVDGAFSQAENLLNQSYEINKVFPIPGYVFGASG